MKLLIFFGSLVADQDFEYSVREAPDVVVVTEMVPHKPFHNLVHLVVLKVKKGIPVGQQTIPLLGERREVDHTRILQFPLERQNVPA